MDFDPAQLTFTYNSRGYMLTYRGKNLGGAGTIKPERSRRNGAMVQADLKMYRENAQYEIQRIKEGTGQTRFLEVIKRIDA